MNGEKWLQLNKIENVYVSLHAREKMQRATNYHPPLEYALECIEKAQYKTIDEVIQLGFSPNYHGRKKRNIESFYFYMTVEHVELIAVIQKKAHYGTFDAVWITTLIHDAESLNRKKLANPD